MKKKSKIMPPTSLKAIDICRPIIALNSSRTLLDARNSMLRYKISRIVVSFDGKAVGIVTEKDIANFLYDSPPARRLSEIALKEMVQKKVLTVNESSTSDHCCKLMLQNNISSLVVNDDQGKDKGIITKTDIVELYANHQPRHITVCEWMSDKVHSVAPDESIHMIALLMNIHKISRVVVQRNMKPIGIVTSRDFLPLSLIHGTESLGRYWTTSNHTTLAKKKQRFIPSGMIGIVLAQDIMPSPPITIHKNVNIAEVSKNNDKEQNKRSPCHKRKRSSFRHNYQNRHIEKWILVKILLKYQISLVSGLIDEAKKCITKELKNWRDKFLEVSCMI